MADALCETLAGEGEPPMRDVRALASWITDVRRRVVLAEDLSYLRLLEDKHMFTREGLTAAATDAGFRDCEIVPNYVDRIGEKSVPEYLRELGIAGPFADAFIAAFRRYAPAYFGALEEQDASGMYICVMRN